MYVMRSTSTEVCLLSREIMFSLYCLQVQYKKCSSVFEFVINPSGIETGYRILYGRVGTRSGMHVMEKAW